MLEKTLQYLDHAGTAIVGFAIAAVGYARGFWSLAPEDNFKRFKIELGRVLTLGLEILVVADVIETITVEPTFSSLAVLAFLVLLRTLVSWTLTLEIKGHWPWQSSAERQGHV